MATYLLKFENVPTVITLSTGKVLRHSRGPEVHIDITPAELTELQAMVAARAPEQMARLAAGPSELRPNLLVSFVGDRYFDVTLNRPVFVNATVTGWVDATGAAV